MKAYYCSTNGILVYAKSIKEAKDYATYRLSPAYGHAPDREKGLKLRAISPDCAEKLDGCSITWEA